MPEPSSDAVIVYDFDVVGGSFDGAPALAWQDDGRHPPPDVILVGVCDVGMTCGTSKCRRKAAHISYWLPEEDGVALGAQRYRKQEEFIQTRASEDDELRGRAVYVTGGLMEPANFGARAREPIGADSLVTAELRSAGVSRAASVVGGLPMTPGIHESMNPGG